MTNVGEPLNLSQEERNARYRAALDAAIDEKQELERQAQELERQKLLLRQRIVRLETFIKHEEAKLAKEKPDEQ